MLKVNFLHVCDDVIMDQTTGKISIIGIFENINALNFPATHPQMAIVAGLEADKPGSYDVELVFLDEQGEIARMPTKVNIGSNLKGNWVHKILMYTIPRNFTQKIILNYDGKKIHEDYILINNK